MYYRYYRSFIPVLLSVLIAACATAPAARAPAPEHLATAKRFLHSFGAGEIAMAGFRQKLEEETKDQPGLAELSRRAFSDIKPEDFEDLAARVYVRHLTQQHLAELANFTESPTGNRFFRGAISSKLEGKPSKVEDMMREFSADELTQIMKFVQSDAFIELQQALPAINRELAEEGQKLGETTMREYIKRQ